MGKGSTREPGISNYHSLDSDVFQDEEFYIYQAAEHEIIRKKIGGWINISKLISLLPKQSIKQAENEVKLYHYQFKYPNQDHVPHRYQGTWIRLKDARSFAINFKILGIVSPLLAFERIAKVTYHGFTYYEFFCDIDVETSLRILRDVDKNKINMKQIFIAYSKLKSAKKNIPIQERQFYNYYKENHSKKIIIRNDSSLCGGFWVPYSDAKQYTVKHGIFNRMAPILDFVVEPDEASDFPIDIFQGKQRMFWRLTKSQLMSYAYPMSFIGGGAPSRPLNHRRFKIDELVTRKTIKTNVTRRHVETEYSVTLVRRFSDGWVNASELVRIGCLIRVTELNFGKEDPENLKLAEMYYRDQIETFKNEAVSSRAAKVINGRWISTRNAKEICKEMKLYSNRNAEAIIEFIEEYSESDNSDSEDENDNIEMINENEFDQLKKVRVGDSFFEKGGESSSEDEVELFDSDTEVIKLKISELDVPETSSEDKEEEEENNMFVGDLDNLFDDADNEIQPHALHEETSLAQIDLIPIKPFEIDKSTIIRKLKTVKASIESLISKKPLPIKRIEEKLENLKEFHAITPEIVSSSQLKTTLNTLNSHYSIFKNQITNLQTEWNNQSLTEAPTTPDESRKHLLSSPFGGKPPYLPIAPRSISKSRTADSRFQFSQHQQHPAYFPQKSQQSSRKTANYLKLVSAAHKNFQYSQQSQHNQQPAYHFHQGLKRRGNFSKRPPENHQYDQYQQSSDPGSNPGNIDRQLQYQLQSQNQQTAPFSKSIQYSPPLKRLCPVQSTRIQSLSHPHPQPQPQPQIQHRNLSQPKKQNGSYFNQNPCRPPQGHIYASSRSTSFRERPTDRPNPHPKKETKIVEPQKPQDPMALIIKEYDTFEFLESVDIENEGSFPKDDIKFSDPKVTVIYRKNERYRKLARFEIDERKELLKRRSIMFDGKAVFAKTLSLMLREKEYRKSQV